MNRDTNIQKTGSIGEKLVYEYLETTDEYADIGFSKNPYDMHKDILVTKDGKKLKIEVKTRTVIRKHYAFPLEKSQWYKADNADRLFFVSNPTSHDEPVHIYEAVGDCYTTLKEFGPRKTETRMYDLGKMRIIKSINDPKIIQSLYELSVSSYKQ